nr:RNA-directed DNA polymerase, eukaryota [Tanacetum cinerariifolium]
MGFDDWQQVSRRSYKKSSKEDDVARISTSIYVTNFAISSSAKDLYHTCKQYGHVVDSFIPVKKSKDGKRFGFVKFINVFDIDILVGNLCTVWIGSHRLHANVARFSRPVANSHKNNGPIAEKVRINSVRVNSSSVSRNNPNAYAQAVKGQAQTDVVSLPVLVLDESCVNKKEFSHCLNGKVKEFGSLANLKMVLCNEGFTDVEIRYLGGLWEMLVFKSIDVKEIFSVRVPMKMWTSNTFKRIGAKWGTLLDVVDSDEDNYHRWIPDFEETSDDASESYNSLSDVGFHGDIGGGDEDNQDEDDVSMVPDSMAD